LGLVRLRVKKSASDFERIFEAIRAKAREAGYTFPEITPDSTLGE